MTGASRCFKGK